MAKKRNRSYGRAGGSEAGEPKSAAPERGSGKGSGRAGRGSDGKSPEVSSELREWIKSLGVAVVLFLILRTFIVGTFVITSGSMEDTLLVGDFLVVNRMAIGSRVPGTDARIPGYSSPRRGDVIVFDPPHEEDLKLVKRLIGFPGDRVEMRDKVLYLNGEAQEEPYLRLEDPPGEGDDYHPWMEWQRDQLAAGVDGSSYRPTRDNWGPLVVPEGTYFMLGDNRDSSLDSRYWGPLDDRRLEARVMFKYFSYNKESTYPFAWIREIRWSQIGRGIR
jgi:signal peptidase I